MSAKIEPFNYMKTLSLLKSLRIMRGLSQAAVAKLVNVDPPKISMLENDLLRDTPGTLRLKGQLAVIFGVAVDELFPKGGQKD